jgi:hypothetical protein
MTHIPVTSRTLTARMAVAFIVIFVATTAIGSSIGTAAQRGSGIGVAQQGETPGLKPTPELREVMRSNAGILAVDGRGGNITGRMGEHLRADDYDGIIADVTALKPNFDKITAFFTAQKMANAIGFARTGSNALVDMETAAKTRDKHGLAQAQIALATSCRNCHDARRVMVLRVPMQFEISQD